VLTADRGLVILSVSETEGGQWQLRYEEKDISLTLCSYNVTVEVQKCSAPTQASEFQKKYAEWCNEFEKHKRLMQTWENDRKVRT